MGTTMIVAQCPSCGAEVGSDDVPQPLRFYVVLAALMVHAATIDTLMELPDYASAKPGWDERIDGLTTQLDGEAQMMEAWGTAFDGEDNEDGERQEGSGS